MAKLVPLVIKVEGLEQLKDALAKAESDALGSGDASRPDLAGTEAVRGGHGERQPASCAGPHRIPTPAATEGQSRMIEDITPHAKTVALKTRVSVPAARGLLRRLYAAGMEGMDATTSLDHLPEHALR